jgi:hypothetical protein
MSFAILFQVSPELSRIDWEEMTIFPPLIVSTSADIDVEMISNGEGNINTEIPFKTIGL